MSRKSLNFAAIIVLLAAGCALAAPAPSLMAISKCKSGDQVCYCSGGCTAGGGKCNCEDDDI